MKNIIALSFALVATLLSIGSSLAEKNVVFIISKHGAYYQLDPSQNLNLGETLDIRSIGRRFHGSKVTLEYDMGDEETVYYNIANSGAKLIVAFDENNKITNISSHSKDVSNENGIKIGEPLKSAIGFRAYCNTYMEDSLPYCTELQDGRYVYYVEYDDNCLLPDRKQDFMKIPDCLKIQGISVY